MPRVVPSQVVSFIDSITSQQSTEFVRMNSIGAGGLLAVLDLVDQVPDELLTMDKDAYGLLIRAKGTIREMLGTWTSNQNAGQTLLTFNLHRSHNPLVHIRGAFAKCADESPAPATAELNFITDPDLRANLRNDVGAINRALANGEWKAATVLAGSAAEAFLLWALRQRSVTDIARAIAAARRARA